MSALYPQPVFEPDRPPQTSLSGPLARLDRSRDELAKAWLMRLIEQASLEEISDLPTDRIAAELPALISELLHAAAEDSDPFERSPQAEDRASRLAALRSGREPTASGVTRDVASIQSVLFEALQSEADDLDAAELLDVVRAVAETVSGLQAAAVETFLDQRSRELETLAHTDPLTGLANLRHLQEQLRHALGVVKRYEEPFALLILDIEGLKHVNNSQGHQAGDRVLVQASLALRRAVRAVDTPARIGGDEFCILAPSQTAQTALPLGERLAEAVGSETAPAGGGPGVGVSVGIVSSPEHGDDADALLEAADQAMYEAKASGRPVAVAEVVAPGRDRAS